MTINQFVYESGITTYGRIIVMGHTENDQCHECHKMYDSCHPRFQGKAIPEDLGNRKLTAIGPYLGKDLEGLVLHFTTDELLYNYL